jgi:hypothetical protein
MNAANYHRIEVDRAGFGGWARYTDYDHHPDGIGATCLRKPWMTDARWTTERDAWLAAHHAPSDIKKIL